MSAFYFVAVAIIFTVCISILCLIFVPKIRASLKPPVETRSNRFSVRAGDPQTSCTSLSDGESVGIKILSSPVAIAQLEEELFRLKRFVAASGLRLPSVVNNDDDEAGFRTRRVSHVSNGSAVVESDAVLEKEKLVTFGSSTLDDVVNHTKMNADDVDK